MVICTAKDLASEQDRKKNDTDSTIAGNTCKKWRRGRSSGDAESVRVVLPASTTVIICVCVHRVRIMVLGAPSARFYLRLIGWSGVVVTLLRLTKRIVISVTSLIWRWRASRRGPRDDRRFKIATVR